MSVVVFGDRNETVVLALAESLARAVDEALDAAILEFAPEATRTRVHVEDVQSIAGKGVAGLVNGQVVALGTSCFLASLGIFVGELGKWAEAITQEGQRTMFVAVNGQPAGFLKLSMNCQKENV